MKNVLLVGYIVLGSLVTSTVGGTMAFAEGLIQSRSAATVHCLVRGVELSSEDSGLDQKKAKTLSIYDNGRLVTQTVSANSERIEFLQQQCEQATASKRGTVLVNVQTAEVVPRGRFLPSVRPTEDVSIKLLSQHKVRPAKHLPGAL